MGTQSVCSRCARSGKTCCQETDIFLTVNDIQRIARDISRIDFYEYRLPADLSYLDQENDPVWAEQTIRSDGSRRVLKQKNGQDCLFLGEAGCGLSMDVRPLVCRLHPYTYDAGGLAEVIDPRCLQAHRESGEDLIVAIGMSAAQAQAWHRQLYDEILTHEGIENNEAWHNLRPAV